MKKIVSDRKYNFFNNLVRKYGRFMGSSKIVIDNKDKFEKDVLKLLKKYNVIDNKHYIQKAEIIVDVKECPKIKLEKIVI